MYAYAYVHVHVYVHVYVYVYVYVYVCMYMYMYMYVRSFGRRTSTSAIVARKPRGSRYPLGDPGPAKKAPRSGGARGSRPRR